MYETLRTIHLIAVIPCMAMGVYLIYFSKKGANLHRGIGGTYMILMLIQAIVSLGMNARVGPQFLNHFGWIHLLSFLTIYTVPKSYFYLRQGNFKAHARSMLLLFWGGLVIAGGFTLVPGRFLHQLLFD